MTGRPWFRAAFLFASISITVTSCAEAPTTSVVRGPRATWEEAGIDSYTYQLTRSCFCPGPFGPITVTVVDGKVESVTHGRKQTPVGEDELGERPLTVDELFGYVDEATGKADDVAVDYDPDLGYPTRISVDWYRNAIDDEMSFTAGGLRILGDA